MYLKVARRKQTNRKNWQATSQGACGMGETLRFTWQNTFTLAPKHHWACVGKVISGASEPTDWTCNSQVQFWPERCPNSLRAPPCPTLMLDTWTHARPIPHGFHTDRCVGGLGGMGQETRRGREWRQAPLADGCGGRWVWQASPGGAPHLNVSDCWPKNGVYRGQKYGNVCFSIVCFFLVF